MRYSATGSASPPNLVPHLSEAGMAVLTPSPEVLGGLPLGEEGDVVFTITLLPQAFAGFYYTFSFLNLTGQQSLSHVNATVWDFCNKNWSEVRAL